VANLIIGISSRLSGRDITFGLSVTFVKYIVRNFYCGSTLNLLYKPILLLVVYLLEVSFSNVLTGTLHIYLRLALQTLVKIVITTCIMYLYQIRTNQFDWILVKGLIMRIYSYFTHTAPQQAPHGPLFCPNSSCWILRLPTSVSLLPRIFCTFHITLLFL